MGGGVHAVTVAPPLLLWAASLYKLPALSRGRDQRVQPALSAYWSAIAWLAVAMTLLVPPLAANLDRLVHVPNAAWLLMYAAVLRSGFSATIALLHESPGPDTRRAERHRRYACAGLIAALAMLFVAAGASVETEDFLMAYAGQPLAAVFLTIFYGGLAFVCIDMAPRCWRAAANVTGLLRLGLRGTSVATALSLGYVAYSETVVVQLVTGHADAVVGDPLAVSRALLLVIVSLIAVGTSAPDWGPRLHLDAAGQALSHYRARRRLFPMWFDVRTAVPAVDVPSPGGRLRPLPPQPWSRWLGQRRAAALRDMLTFHDATFQLHRRVIDVTDGRLALADFLHPAEVDRLLASVPHAAQDRAAVEAARLAAGVAAKLEHRPGQPIADDATGPALDGLDGWSLQNEVEHLARVAGYYRRFQPRLARAASAAPSDSPAASSQT